MAEARCCSTPDATGEVSSNRVDTRQPFPVRECREIILQMVEPLADMCRVVTTGGDPILPLSALFAGLLLMSDVSGINLPNCVFHKLRLNALKYPVALCEVSHSRIHY
jgi:hypothetical protein